MFPHEGLSLLQTWRSIWTRQAFFLRVKFIQQLNSLILALSHNINDSIFKHEPHIITIWTKNLPSREKPWQACLFSMQRHSTIPWLPDCSQISQFTAKFCFSAKYSFFGQSLSHGHYHSTYQPLRGVYTKIRFCKSTRDYISLLVSTPVFSI